MSKSKSKKRLRKRRVTVSYTEEEYADLQKLYIRTTGLHLSDYVRKISLAEPVEMKIRNASFDDFLSAIIPLQSQLRTLRRKALFTPADHAAILELHRSIQLAIEKIALPCMPS